MRMRSKAFGTILAAVVWVAVCVGADANKPLRLLMPEERMLDDDAAEKLRVTIDCGYIAGIDNIPELWNISMGFNMPSVQEFEARVRLGAAAGAKLGGWNRSIRVHVSEQACFKIEVVVEGR